MTDAPEEDLGLDELSVTETLAIRDRIVELASHFIETAMDLIDRLEHLEISPAITDMVAGDGPSGDTPISPDGPHPDGNVTAVDVHTTSAGDFPSGSPLSSLDRLAIIDAIRSRKRNRWAEQPNVGQAWLRGYLRRHGHPGSSVASVPTEILLGALTELETLDAAIGVA